MFSGEFSYRVDEKGRVPIPPRFRQELKAGMALTMGMEKCITIYPIEGWKKLADSLTPGAIASNKFRRINRTIFGTAFETSIDGQGRIVIPQPLKLHAGLKEDVVVIGANTYLEIWGKKAWEAEKVQSLEAAWQDVESLERRS